MRLAEIVKPTTTRFYHVTFQKNVPAIRRDGLVVGRRRNWENMFGGKLGSTKALYVFTDFTAAVRWAHHMEYEHEKPVSILVIDNPPNDFELDDGVSFSHNGTGFLTTTPIPAQYISHEIKGERELYREIVQKGRAVDPTL